MWVTANLCPIYTVTLNETHSKHVFGLACELLSLCYISVHGLKINIAHIMIPCSGVETGLSIILYDSET